jgi:glutathione S-transferase
LAAIAWLPPRHTLEDTIMIDLYYWTTPNGHKITIFLEEAGVPYTIKPVNISTGEQFKPEFLKISPNNRIPAMVDTDPADGKGPIADTACYPWIVPHERHKQKLDEFKNLHRWFTAIQQRPAVQRAYELAKTINTKPTVNHDSKSILFGQGRRTA